MASKADPISISALYIALAPHDVVLLNDCVDNSRRRERARDAEAKHPTPNMYEVQQRHGHAHMSPGTNLTTDDYRNTFAYLSFYLSIYLPIFLYVHIHTYIHISFFTHTPIKTQICIWK